MILLKIALFEDYSSVLLFIKKIFFFVYFHENNRNFTKRVFSCNNKYYYSFLVDGKEQIDLSKPTEIIKNKTGFDVKRILLDSGEIRHAMKKSEHHIVLSDLENIDNSEKKVYNRYELFI